MSEFALVQIFMDIWSMTERYALCLISSEFIVVFGPQAEKCQRLYFREIDRGVPEQATKDLRRQDPLPHWIKAGKIKDRQGNPSANQSTYKVAAKLLSNSFSMFWENSKFISRGLLRMEKKTVVFMGTCPSKGAVKCTVPFFQISSK